jgi:tetratricopeptide (TPR) repeat protein
MRQAAELARRWRTMPSAQPGTERTVLIARVLVSMQYMVGFAGWSSRDNSADEVVAIARESGDPAALIDAQTGAIQVELMTRSDGRRDEVRAMANETLELATRLGDPSRLGWIQSAMAVLEAPVDMAAAEHLLELAMENARRSGSPWAIAGMLQMRGYIAGQIGREAEAQRFFREAQSRFLEIGDTRFATSSQSNYAHSLRRTGALDDAIAEYRQTIREWQRTGNRGAVANQLECIAFIALAQGDASRAARLLGAAESLREAADAPMTSDERLEYDAAMDRLRGLLDPDAFTSTWAAGRRLTPDEAVAFAVSG